MLTDAEMDVLFAETIANEGYQITVDLPSQTVTTPSGQSFSFEVDNFRKHCLLNGLDDIGLTLEKRGAIEAYEAKRISAAPWLF